MILIYKNIEDIECRCCGRRGCDEHGRDHRREQRRQRGRVARRSSVLAARILVVGLLDVREERNQRLHHYTCSKSQIYKSTSFNGWTCSWTKGQIKIIPFPSGSFSDSSHAINPSNEMIYCSCRYWKISKVKPVTRNNSISYNLCFFSLDCSEEKMAWTALHRLLYTNDIMQLVIYQWRYEPISRHAIIVVLYLW